MINTATKHVATNINNSRMLIYHLFYSPMLRNAWDLPYTASSILYIVVYPFIIFMLAERCFVYHEGHEKHER